MAKFIIIKTYNDKNIIINLNYVVHIEITETSTVKDINANDSHVLLRILRIYKFINNEEVHEILEQHYLSSKDKEYETIKNKGLKYWNGDLMNRKYLNDIIK